MNEKNLINFKLNTIFEIVNRLLAIYFNKTSDFLITFDDCLIDIFNLLNIFEF